MNFYRIVDTAQESRPDYRARFECTMAEAHDYAKSTPKVSWSDIRVELLDMDTSKESVCSVLNGQLPGTPISMCIRTWSLTPRGALAIVANGE